MTLNIPWRVIRRAQRIDNRLGTNIASVLRKHNAAHKKNNAKGFASQHAHLLELNDKQMLTIRPDDNEGGKR